MTATTALREVSAFLLSKRQREVRQEPFRHFWVEDFLPADVYRALLETFPGEADLVGYADASKHLNKRFLNSSHHSGQFQAFLARRPLWRALIDAFASAVVIDDFYQLVRRDLLRARGPGALRVWRGQRGLRSGWKGMLFEPVGMHFEFSRLGRGSYIMPHTDTSRKLASLLLYFPDPDWKEAYGGGTVLYRPGVGMKKGNWENRTVPFGAVVAAETVDFVPNRLVVFLKSSISYHGVPPVPCPPAMARNSLNINYMRLTRASADPAVQSSRSRT